MVQVDKKIIFFDGYCHLCNGYIDFLATINFSKNIYFASLQGKTAENLVDKSNREELSTLIYYKSNKFYTKSNAVIESLSDAFILFNLLKIFYIIPHQLRDLLYEVVARNRYSFFGHRETCRIPTQAETKNILD